MSVGMYGAMCIVYPVCVLHGCCMYVASENGLRDMVHGALYADVACTLHVCVVCQLRVHCDVCIHTCMLHVWCMCVACMLHAYCMCAAYTLHAWCMCVSRVLYMCCMYAACMLHARCMYVTSLLLDVVCLYLARQRHVCLHACAECMLHVCCMCAAYVCCMRAACVPHACYMCKCAACMLHACCMYVACMLHV